MSDYVFETGAVLMMGWFALIADVVIIYAIVIGVWPVAALIPPLGFIHFVIVNLWKTRPSLRA